MVGAVSDFEWDPEAYLELMLGEIPGYEEIEDAVADATRGPDVHAVLELGTGTGETSDAAIYIDWVMDLPSSVPEQLGWLDEAGFDANATLVRADLGGLRR